MSPDPSATGVSAETVLMRLPTPIVAHDRDGSVVYANEAFRMASVVDPEGMEIRALLDGYEPGEGGGFVTPNGTDRTFVAIVRTPARVRRGEDSPTTVLALRTPPDDSDQSVAPTQSPGKGRIDSQVEAMRTSPTVELPGPEVSAEEVLMSLATPIAAHDTDGAVVFANEAFRRDFGAEPVGRDIGTLIDGYGPGGDGGIVTAAEGDRNFFALVRAAEQSESDASEQITVLTLQLRTPDDAVGGASSADRRGPGWLIDDQIAEPLERIIENSNDAVFVHDIAEREFAYVNERAGEMLGYEPAELLALSPRDVHPHDYPKVGEFMKEALEQGSSHSTELSCYHATGTIIPVEVSASLVEIDDQQLLVANVRDISTRVEQRAELRRLSRAMEATAEGVALFDQDGMVTYANPAFAAAVGAGDVDSVRGRTWGEVFGEDDQFEMVVRPAAGSEDGWTETVHVTADGEERAYALSATLVDEYLICVARDVTDRQRRVERLRGLTAASRAFVDSEDAVSVAESAVSVIKETMGFHTVCFRLYDAEANALERVAETSRAAELLAEEVAYDMDASRAGQAFKTGERLSINAGDDAYAADRGHLHVPVGEAGVITVAAPSGFRESDAELIGLFAETVRTALSRVERLEQLREREAELDDQRSELAAAVEFNDLVVDVIQSVVSSSTREETERAVCERLVASGQYAGVWILGEDRTVRAKSVAAPTELPSSGKFVTSALADRLFEEMSDGITVERRRFDASEEPETTTAAAVPIRYGRQDFGTLVVLTQEENAFPDAARGGMELLAETLGFAIVAGRSREALLSSDVTEIELCIESPFAELSAVCDCRCVIREVSSTESGDMLYTVAVTGAGADEIRSVLGDVPRVESITSDGPEECTVRVLGDVYEGSGRLLTLLANAGANIRSVVAENGNDCVTAEVPEGVDVSALMDRIREQFESVTLRSRRSRRRLAPDRAISEDALTDRQREVVCTAHGMGYYEWPREHTAEEVAETLNVAGSTLHQHLRTAQGKLAEHLCEDESEAD